MTTAGLPVVVGAARGASAPGAASDHDPAADDIGAAALNLVLARENDELRRQLGAARERLVEVATETGELHARIDALRAELAEMRAGRNAWRAEAERLVEWANGRT